MVDSAVVRDQLEHALTGADFPGLGPPRHHGACDVFDLGEYHLLITSDRVCRGDVTLGTVPFKGEVTTRVSIWWLDVTGDLLPSPVEHLIDPQALLVRPMQALPMRLAVHGLLSGRLWRAYDAGLRRVDGVELADGMTRDHPLDAAIVLPIPADGDPSSVEPLALDALLAGGSIDEAKYVAARDLALKVFERGLELASARGVMLVDTVYQFGTTGDGVLTAIDLVHAPTVTTYRRKDESHTDTVRLSEHEILEAWADGAGDMTSMPTELRLRLADAYLRLGEFFIADFEPHSGPVTNRLTLSLSVAGLMA